MDPQKNNPEYLQKILIIEDDPDILGVAKCMLTDAGFKVYTYMSGLDVEAAVLYYLPDLILLDIGLPGLSGVEVCKEIKKLYKLPIIIFSAHEQEGRAYKEYMADGFIQKPFNMAHFVDTVKRQLNEISLHSDN